MASACALLLAAALAAPGGVAKVALGGGAQPPQTTLDGNRVMVMRDEKGWCAVVGVPLSAKPGEKLVLDVRYPDERRVHREITVRHRKYASQRLKVPPDQAELGPEQLAQYERERKHLQEVLRTFSDPPPASLALRAPVEGRRSGSFGLRRIINDEPRSPHSGMDIAADAGTPVAATAAGRVLDVGEYLFLGRTVILDHGQGLLSLYAHLSEVSAARDQDVAPGVIIGKVGASGRATGPHLHFSVYLNTAAVDPALFLGDKP